jgi:DNA-binding MarR family transcriptional regulator
MLETANISAHMESAITRYLADTLGLRAELRPWNGAGQVPFFLHEAFTILQLSLGDSALLIAIDTRPEPQRPAQLRVQIERLRTAAQLPVIYVTDALASYERRRFIELGVPFLVPGNQLYLPDLGIDLREYFRARRPAAGAHVSPSTQAVLIAMLLTKPWRSDWVVAEIVARLGYTPMTLTRVLRELRAEGIADIYRDGRERRLHVDGTPDEIWQRAKKFLTSPVKRSVWMPTLTTAEPARRLAGLSALAHLTQLADPPLPVYAISPDDWRAVKQTKQAVSMRPMEGYAEWEVWSYPTAILSQDQTVDPLSLMLSLEHVADERVQLALDELRGQLSW